MDIKLPGASGAQWANGCPSCTLTAVLTLAVWRLLDRANELRFDVADLAALVNDSVSPCDRCTRGAWELDIDTEDTDAGARVYADCNDYRYTPRGMRHE